MFKIGDRVKVVFGWWKGHGGVVKYIGEYEGLPTYGVEMDFVNDGEGYAIHETYGSDLETVMPK